MLSLLNRNLLKNNLKFSLNLLQRRNFMQMQGQILFNENYNSFNSINNFKDNQILKLDIGNNSLKLRK